MNTKNFVLGKHIEMCIVKTIDIEDIDQAPHDYVSKIVECADNKILVETPIKDRYYVPVHKSDIIHVLGEYDGEYGSVYTSVIDIILGEIPILVLEFISEVKRVQRRGLYRLSKLKNVKFKVFNNYNTSVEYQAYLMDISGGGAAISTEIDMNEESSILLEIDLDGEEIAVYGDIVRKQYSKDKHRYIYGVYFSSIDSNNQDKIIQYIFREQARSIKCGIRE